MPVTSRRKARFIVFSRNVCHLCDELLAALKPICDEFQAVVDVVDVDDSPKYLAEYGQRVPVVVGGETELCHFFLDASAIRAYLLNFR